MQRIPWIQRNLPEALAGTELEDSLVHLLGVAAVVGARSSDDYLVSFTSIACALLLCGDEASLWFSKFLREHADGATEAILRGRGVRLEAAKEILAQAEALDEPPERRKLWTASAERTLANAKALAGGGAVGVRHLVAAYGFDPPPGHDQQLRDWGIDTAQWRTSFLTFLGDTALAAAIQKRLAAPPESSGTTSSVAGGFIRGVAPGLTEHLEFLAVPPDRDLARVLQQATQFRGEVSSTALFLALVDHGKEEDAGEVVRALASSVDNEQVGEFRASYLALDRYPLGVADGAREILTNAVAVHGELQSKEGLSPDMVAVALLRRPSGKVAKRLADIGQGLPGLSKKVAHLLRGSGSTTAAKWAELLGDADVPPPTAAPAKFPADPRSETPSIAPFDPDSVDGRGADHLDVEREAAAFARVAASRSLVPPIAFGVFGEWGSGKTFFMEKMHSVVDRCAKAAAAAAKEGQASAYHADIVQIRFNAWHYMESNLWASLVDHIFHKLDDWLQPKHEQDEVRKLYAQLSTARTLKLEALEALLAVRRSRRDAEKRLRSKRAEMAEVERQRAQVTPEVFWGAVGKVASELLPEKEALARAVADLGLGEAKETASALLVAIEQGRETTQRAALAWRAMVARAGSPHGAALLVAVILGAPLLFSGLVAGLGWLDQNGFVASFAEAIQSPLLALSSSLASILGWVGMVMRRANQAMQTVESFRRKLDAKLAAKRDGANASPEPDAVLETQANLERRRQEVVLAEQALARADAGVAAAVQEFHESARSRMNRFIREKVAAGDYAKHLGIIATIRRDFEQLAQIMGDEKRETEAAREFKAERAAYSARLQAFLQEEGQAKSRATGKEGEAAGPEAPEQKGSETGHPATASAQNRKESTPQVEGESLLLPDERKALEQEITELQQDVVHADLRFFRRIVLYIDDLDRCPPAKVVDVLQACHLLLCFPLFVVVVAVDARWVSLSLLRNFDGLLTDANAHRAGPLPSEFSTRPARGGASPSDYLEKVFQIPYWVRPINADSSKRLVADLASAGDAVTSQPIERKTGSTPRGSVAQPGESHSGGADAVDEAPTTKVPDHDAIDSVESVRAAKVPPEGERSSPGAGSVASQGTPPARPEDPDPASLRLTSFERRALEDLAPFAGDSPRNLKRFVNVYRVLRSSLPDGAGTLVGAEGDRLDYRAILTQLAIVTGAPLLADAFFEALASETSKGGSPSALLGRLEQRENGAKPPEWQFLQGALRLLAGTNDSKNMIERMQHYAPLVKRFSFSAGGTL